MKKILLGIMLIGAGLFASDLTKSCVGCHGVEFEKSALGKSMVVKELTTVEIEKALNGYKDGTYGREMKGVMKGQVARLTEDDIKTIAFEIGKPVETVEKGK